MTNPWLSKHIFFPLNELRTGKRMLRKLDEMHHVQVQSPEEIRQYQQQKLVILLLHARKTTEYYHELFETIGVQEQDLSDPQVLQRIPVLTKDLIRSNFQRLISSAVPENRMTPNSTGGSTGENLKFFTDHNARDWRSAALYCGHEWAGVQVGEPEAYLWGAPFDIKAWEGFIPKIKMRLRNIMMLSTYDLSPENMRRYAKLLDEYKPSLITAYPTPFSTFARFLQQERLDTLRPRAIISSAETLFDEQRTTIESIFKAPVFNRYGMREFGDVAQECREHNGLHVFAERVIIEVLLPDGTPAAPGQLGEIAITDLDNYGFPFIRYKPGDLGILSDRICPCGMGLPMLERVEGRVLDMIVTPSGKMLGGTFWTLLVRSVEGVFRFQVIQKSLEQAELRIVPDSEFTQAARNSLEAKLKEYAAGLAVNIVLMDEIPLTRSGKFRVVINEVPGIVESALQSGKGERLSV